MPQLMPLNWIFSVLVVLLILMSASFIYSESIMNMAANDSKYISSKTNMWCW